MKLKIYLAQIKPGHYEASIPWVEALAEPIRGPSPSQLKEELMFRAVALMHEGLAPAFTDRLIPPDEVQALSVYVETAVVLNPERPAVEMSCTTHVLMGRWEGDEIWRIWIPKIPGAALAMRSPDEVYAAASSFVNAWAHDNALESLEEIDSPYWSKIEEIEVDLGAPTPPSGSSSAARSSASGQDDGRMRRPQVLGQIATNLTQRAADSTLERAWGREALVERLVDIMSAPTPLSICLVGAPGVGKSSVIHEAVQRIWAAQKRYQKRRDFWETSGDRIIAGMSIIGQWEQRVGEMIEELSARRDVLVVQDILGLVRAGKTYHGDSNVARFIEPALEQHRFAIVAEASEETYALARSLAPGFVDKFERLHVEELGFEQTIAVLTELVRHIEGEHDAIRFMPDGLETILALTRRFELQEALPGKAVRLTRQCETWALRAFHESDQSWEQIIDASFVAGVFERQTGLPRAILEPGTGRSFEAIRESIGQRVFAQPEAVEIASGLVTTIEQGLTDPSKPLGSLMLVGPSGVGKTETAKALAEQLFGSDERLVRFDMSEFATPLATSRLIGSPSSPDGELTGKVRLQPFAVILFDEIEKAHPHVHDLLLQVLGEGRLTDAIGRTVDFRNAVVVMTSNLGAQHEEHWLGFGERGMRDRLLHYTRSVETFFRPEFFNRIDHVVPFRGLGAAALRRIAQRTLGSLLERRGLRQARVMVDVDEALIEHLIEGAVDPRYGARTLGRRIERALIAPLAMRLTTHTESENGITRVHVVAGEGEEVDLSLEAIELAPRQHHDEAVPVGQGLEEESDSPPQWLGRRNPVDVADAAQLAQALQSTASRLDGLEQRPEVGVLTTEYASLLDRLNDPGALEDASEAGEIAERLRQREVALRRLKDVRHRLDAVLDPRGTGEYVFPMAQEISRDKGKRWARVVGELSHEIEWISTQFTSLFTREVDAATLVVSGLSGPYGPLITIWLDIMRALDRRFELDATCVEFHAGRWHPLGTPSSSGRDAIAISAEAPGVLALFHALTGYCFAPRLPSHGQHALVALNVVDRGVVDLVALIDALEGSDPQEWDQEMRIEFIEKEGKIEDVRLGRAIVLPEVLGENMERFSMELVMPRIALREDVYPERMRSGIWRALKNTGEL